MKRRLVYSQIPRGRGTPHYRGPQGKHQGQSQGRGSAGRMWAGAVIVAFMGKNWKGVICTGD